MVKGYKDTIMEYFNIIMASLMVVLMVGVMMIVVQVSDNKAFISFAEDVVSRYGAVTPEATEEINSHSQTHYGGKYTVVGGTETVQKYGEPIEFHIKGDFAVDFLGNEGTFGFKIPFISIDLKDVATSRVRTEVIDTSTYTYVVNFNDYNGSLISSQIVNRGNSPIIPANPSRLGYTFTGWSIDPTLPIYEDVVIVANYEINKYTVSFNLNGGSGSIASQTVNHGSLATVPTNPTRTGYTFAGWSPAIGNPITGNTTFTAQWEINKYTVSFNLNGGSGSIASQTVNHGSKATVPTNPTRTGYTFAGWSPSIGSTITGNTTFTAQWRINKYTVTFNSNGGTAVASQTVNYGSKATVPTNPTRTGYTFAGWSPSIGNPITGNTTFTAQWTAIPITTHSKTVTSTFSNDSRYTLTLKYTMKYQGSVLQSVDYEYYIRKSSGTGFYSHIVSNNYYKVTVAGRERASGNLEYDFRSSPKAGVYFNNTNTKKGTISINSSSFTNNITVTVTLANLGTATSSGNFNK